MSVNINLRPTNNATRWASIKNGDFAIIEGNHEHPIPPGLYRIFVITPSVEETDILNQDTSPKWILLPLFDGPFNPGMFPYVIESGTLPEIKQIVSKLHIEVEVI